MGDILVHLQAIRHVILLVMMHATMLVTMPVTMHVMMRVIPLAMMHATMHVTPLVIAMDDKKTKTTVHIFLSYLKLRK